MNIAILIFLLLQYAVYVSINNSLSTPVQQSGHRAGELNKRKADTNIIVCTSILLFPSSRAYTNYGKFLQWQF